MPGYSLIHGNQHVFKGTVTWLAKEAPNGFFKTRVKIMGLCHEHPWTIGQEVEIMVPVTACNIQSLKEGSTWVFIANDEVKDGATIPCVISCGLIDVDWVKIDEVCGNPCKKCKDIVWLLKQNPDAVKFQGKVIDVDHGKIAAKVQVKAVCEHDGIEVDKTVIVVFSGYDCNANLIKKDAIVTLVGKWDKIEGDITVVKLLECGILPGDKWPEVEHICKPCKKCTQDLVWLVKNNPQAHKFRAEVIEQVVVDKVHAAAKVKITAKCKESDTYGSGKTAIIVYSVLDCKAELIQKGAILTLLGVDDTIEGISVIKLLECGILPGDLWDEVYTICNPCKECTQDLLWLFKNNALSFSAKVTGIHEVITISKLKFIWVTVKVLKACDYGSDRVTIQEQKILVPLHACKADELAIGMEFTFFGEWRMIGSTKIVVINQCGITKFDWNDVYKLCNPCKDCSQDLLWLVKNNEHAFSAKVVEIHEEDTIENEKFKWITVKVLQNCKLYAERAVIQTIKILVPTHACKADELAVGKEFTFFGQWKMIRGVKVVIV
eukprot:CAMPEP_0117454952 /NCGR_PEP_ID=MMETSP0759-20121206/11091_1 /TAXON_ID=63605 /ORGANISM="Percolomonas cosmopolitus, Strain WS" /LENGTH=547 /DNA_ID=CAMNT_0005248205 /DNA_START=89 /DNA_END=1728 /DNA_ORIENTATION=-